MRQRGFEIISEEMFNKLFYPFDIKYEKLKLPKRATAKSAGYDVFTPIDILLEPNEEVKIPLGIKAYMLDDEVLLAYPRSSHGFKYYVRLANTIGIIDADFYNNPDNEGNIWLKIRNEGNSNFFVEKGDAICQLIFQKYLLSDGDDFTGKKRGGGIGSTDTNRN